MVAIAKGRTIHGIHNGFELRKSQTGYNGVLEAENGNIAPEKA